jgi:hypothetical protein
MASPTKLRLLLWSDCDRSCAGCCNRDWDLTKIPHCLDYTPYSTIMLTGGEPMLRPSVLRALISVLRDITSAKLILYTARTQPPDQLLDITAIMDGLTLTLHTQSDVVPFQVFHSMLMNTLTSGLSLRLNVFAGLSLPADLDLSAWQLKTGMTWIPNCPLPEGEVLMQLPRLILPGAPE